MNAQKLVVVPTVYVSILLVHLSVIVNMAITKKTHHIVKVS